MCKNCVIDKPKISLEDFKNSFLKNNYNENMFKDDGSFNPKYNSKKKTVVIAQILEDYWDKISEQSKHNILIARPNADKEVKKIIDCYNKNLGCSVYYCEDCDEFTYVGHTCKSRFCTSCGYKYKLYRTENIIATAYNCKHRHIVFTMPEELRYYFFVKYEVMINILFEAVNLTINSILNESFKKENGKLKKYVSALKYTPGYFAFLHTFGRDMKWNPHIHVLLAEIKLTKDKCENWNYFSFNALRKRFMRNLLDLMSKELGPSFDSMKSKMYKEHKKGFYVYAKKKKFKKLKDLIE